MTRMIFAIAIILPLYSTAGRASQCTMMRVDPSQPSVYLSPDLDGSRGDFVRVKLTNNTPCPIQVYAGTEAGNTVRFSLMSGAEVYAFKQNATVDACYDIEPKPRLTSKARANKIELEIPVLDRVPKVEPNRSCWWGLKYPKTRLRIWLLSAQSVFFAIPRNLIRRNARICTEFSYEWEVGADGLLDEREPSHTACISGSSWSR